MLSRMKRKHVYILSTAALILMIVLSAGFLLPVFLESPLKSALVEEFNKQSGMEYTLSVSDINIEIWTGTIGADSLRIMPENDSAELRSLEMDQIRITGIKWLSLLTRSFPDFDDVTIQRPRSVLRTRPISPEKPGRSDSSAASLMKGEARIFDVHIIEGSGKIIRSDQSELFTLGSFSLTAENVNLQNILRGSYIPYLDELTFSGRDLVWNLDRNLYRFSIGEFSFSKKEEKATVQQLAFTPMAPKYRFAELRGRQLDRYDLSVASIRFSGLDLGRIAENEIEIDSLLLSGSHLDVFHDKHMEPATGMRYKPLLNEVAHRIPYSLELNTAVIEEANIYYGEHRPAAPEPGYVTFNDISAELNNFRTASHPDFRKDTLKLELSTRFMDSSELKLKVRYPVFDKKETHFIDASLASFNPEKASGMLNNVAFVEVKSGIVNSMDWKMKLTNEQAEGTMRLDYQNLKISMLSKNASGSKTLRTRISSFVANNFILDGSNTGPDLKPGEIRFEREKDKGIFGYWWKATLSGIKSTIK